MNKYSILLKLLNVNKQVLKIIPLSVSDSLINFQKLIKMSSSNSSSDLNMEHVPLKKMKLDSDLTETMSERRTVATMCGSWRPEEVDGGHIFVLKTRDGGMSPDPINIEDYPENIEDFWEASFMNIDIDQVWEADKPRLTAKHYV